MPILLSVLWQREARFITSFAISFVCSAHCGNRVIIKKVQTEAQVNYSTDDSRFHTAPSRIFFCPFQRSLRAIFPEVNSWTEPIIGVLTIFEIEFPLEHLLGYRIVATVKAKSQVWAG